MSHFFGYVGNKQAARCPSFIPDYRYQKGNIGIYFPQNARNLYHSFDSQSGTGIVAVGTLLKKQKSSYRLLDAEDFSYKSNTLSVPKDELHLEGHYAILEWKWGGNSSSISITLDRLGIRPVYIYKQATKGEAPVFYFSTRLDWLSKIMAHPTLNASALGSFWFNLNQITSAPFLNNVIKPDGGTTTLIDSQGIQTEKSEDITFRQTFEEERFTAILAQISNPETPLTNSISLSGGLDSRVIIALTHGEYHTHSFGKKSDLDVLMARKIAKKVGSIHHECIINPLTFKANRIEIVDFVVQTQGTSACSDSYLWNIMSVLHDQDIFITDGGFGEIHRRQFLEKLTFLKKDCSQITQADLVKALAHEKPAFFCKDFYHQLSQKREEGIWKKWQQACQNAENSIEKAADLFSLSTRIKNISAMNQGWFDSHITNYMPFIQPSVLASTLLIDPALKSNGKVFRNIIRQHSSLHKLPLVKEGITYPFNLPSIAQKLMLKANKLFKRSSGVGFRNDFLNLNKEYILDRLHAQETRSEALYDYDKIYNNVTSFYDPKNSTNEAQFVMTWLTFDIFKCEVL